MPRYEYRCRTCERSFEVSRPMSQSAADAPCPDGHPDTQRLLSIAGMTGVAAASGTSAPRAAASGASGGCCGGGCCG